MSSGASARWRNAALLGVVWVVLGGLLFLLSRLLQGLSILQIEALTR